MWLYEIAATIAKIDRQGVIPLVRNMCCLRYRILLHQKIVQGI
nr:MAG TPA: FhuF 2Fe-2S C-terminal domain [Caudoviricetes sp.]